MDADMLVSLPLQTCTKGVLCYPLPDRILCPLQFLILYRKRVVIRTTQCLMLLAPQVLSCLRIPVDHRRRRGHIRNSMLVNVIPLGTKSRHRCRAGKRERGGPDFSYMIWLQRGVLVLNLVVPLTTDELFLPWHCSPTRDTCHLR